MLFWDWTLIIILPAIIFGLIAQSGIQRTYAKYSQVYSRSGWTAAQVARDLLDRNGLYDVQVQRTDRPGLSDHYDPRANALRLSQGVYSSSSVAAIGIAAHEVGHAIQKSRSYIPLTIRNSILPVVQISSFAAWPLLFIGLILASYDLALLGVALFGATVLFQLVTLPVEFNASSRALASINDIGYLEPDETQGAKKVLDAAAMTYVAAALMSVMQLLRFLTIAQGSRRR
ncbi:MAG: zinc metallopeptidase [Christensenellales bacterium]|jgi:Zn-dependent membrane protease YugP